MRDAIFMLTWVVCAGQNPWLYDIAENSNGLEAILLGLSTLSAQRRAITRDHDSLPVAIVTKFKSSVDLAALRDALSHAAHAGENVDDANIEEQEDLSESNDSVEREEKLMLRTRANARAQGAARRCREALSRRSKLR
mmetsp:Transcript_92841/g.145873  ORF Transcript_92841/g.145873 Transcript_92841/m.145873 type:complete len:138 (-) Transcript_92841:37-450(-)